MKLVINRTACTFLLCLFIVIGLQAQSILTPLEKYKYSKLTASSEVVEFIKNLSEKNPVLMVDTIGYSFLGKPIIKVRFQNTSNAMRPIRVLLFAQQHGNEPSGKEGLLMLIRDLCEGKHNQFLKNIDLTIVPMINPDGADADKRRNGAGRDLNRDHLLMETTEIWALHRLFDSLQPQITVDFHEYYPYDSIWYSFGYLRQFDIQFGCLTNINIYEPLRNYSNEKVFPFVKKEIEASGFSFFEYTPGSLAHKERLRRSTVDINDGRQSFGIQGTMSFIVEGIAGKTQTELIRRRSEGQYSAALAVLKFASGNIAQITNVVNEAREFHSHLKDSVSLRLEHYKGNQPLNYPLYSIKSGKDTLFIVDEYHTEIRSTVNVLLPKGYLVPKSDSNLVNFIQRAGFVTSEFTKGLVNYYQINSINTEIFEGDLIPFPQVQKYIEATINRDSYIFVPVEQQKGLQAILAFEPQSSIGILVYPVFKYLLKPGKYPILRME